MQGEGTRTVGVANEGDVELAQRARAQLRHEHRRQEDGAVGAVVQRGHGQAQGGQALAVQQLRQAHGKQACAVRLGGHVAHLQPLQRLQVGQLLRRCQGARTRLTHVRSTAGDTQHCSMQQLDTSVYSQADCPFAAAKSAVAGARQAGDADQCTNHKEEFRAGPRTR